MARVKLSGLITDITGSIGGTTFQRSGSGLIARNKPAPLKSKTNAQTTVRVLQSQLNYEWLALTDSQRQTWRSFAEFTNGYGLTNKGNGSANTGKMQFIAVNFWILLYGKPLLTIPTFQPPLDPFIPCPPLYNQSNSLMNYTGSLDTSTQILVTRVSLPQSLATRTANTGFRTLVYNQVNGDTQNWAAAYAATFGVSLVLGKKYWIELQAVDFTTGSISAPARKLVEYVAADNSLKLTVDTTNGGSASDTFILPCFNIGVYNATIDWGDNTSSTITTWNDADLSHTYAIAGVYTISINGDLPAIYFNNSGDRLKLLDIVQWGTWQPEQVDFAFRGCSNLTGSFSDTLDLSGVTSVQQMFGLCTSFNGNVSSWDMSTIVNMTAMFLNCSAFNQDIGGWNTSSVTAMSSLFFGTTIFNQDIGSWDVSSVVTMLGMFGSTSAFNQSLDNWDVSAVTTMQGMFNSATAYNQDSSSWVTTALTNMRNMYNAASAWDQDISSYDISNVTDMGGACENSGLSTANYDAILIGWAAQAVQPVQLPSFIPTTYTIATSGAARAVLTGAPNNWVISDGGGV